MRDRVVERDADVLAVDRAQSPRPSTPCGDRRRSRARRGLRACTRWGCRTRSPAPSRRAARSRCRRCHPRRGRRRAGRRTGRARAASRPAAPCSPTFSRPCSTAGHARAVGVGDDEGTRAGVARACGARPVAGVRRRVQDEARCRRAGRRRRRRPARRRRRPRRAAPVADSARTIGVRVRRRGTRRPAAGRRVPAGSASADLVEQRVARAAGRGGAEARRRAEARRACE